MTRLPRLPRALVALGAAVALPLALALPDTSAVATTSAASPSAAVPPSVSAPYHPARAAGQPVPRTPANEPAAIEPLAEYQGQAVCDPAEKPGTLALAALLRTTYGPADIGISRACSDGGQSEHKEGRALDWMLSYKVPAQRAKVEAFLSWLLATDKDGHVAANAARLGIMYIGFHDRIWKSYAPTQGWTELKGCFSKQTAADDTYCHRDHAHFSLSWDAAAGRTTFFGAAPELRPTCPEPDASARSQSGGVARAVTSLPAWRLIDSRSGTGVGGTGCRIAGDRWSGDGRAVRVKVTGRGRVPASGVAAVRLVVTVVGSNAPSAVYASPTGSRRTARYPVGTAVLTNVVRVRINHSAAATVIAPVASNGTITLVDLAGAADLRVVVTGWLAKAPVVTPPVTTPPGPKPPVTPPAPPVAPPAHVVAFAVPRYPGSPIRPGSAGPAVTAVQRSLLARGFAIPSLKSGRVAFGRYASETLTAVLAYQRKNPALGKADGIVGPRTYAALTAIAAGH